MGNKNKNNKGHDYSTLLIWAAALVTVIRYSAAFIASDSSAVEQTLSVVITYATGLSGIGMGILDVIGGAYLFDGWRRTMPAVGVRWPNKFSVLTFFVVGLIVNGIFILIPYTASRVSGVTMHTILGDGPWLYAWSTFVNVAPYLLIGGVSVGNQIVTVSVSKTDEQSANGSANGSLGSFSEKSSSRTYSSLTNTEKYFIVNNDSKLAASEIGVSQRAIQKWRIKIQGEMQEGKL